MGLCTDSCPNIFCLWCYPWSPAHKGDGGGGRCLLHCAPLLLAGQVVPPPPFVPRVRQSSQAGCAYLLGGLSTHVLHDASGHSDGVLSCYSRCADTVLRHVALNQCLINNNLV